MLVAFKYCVYCTPGELGRFGIWLEAGNCRLCGFIEGLCRKVE